MQINYRILSVDESEGTIVVRYWTDILSERALSVLPDEQSNVPARCRTDYNLVIPDPAMTPEQIHDFAVSNAPVDWFEVKHTGVSLPQIAPLVGVNRTAKIEKKAKALRETVAAPSWWSDQNEVDITHLLSDGS
jgi:hypothetical protein